MKIKLGGLWMLAVAVASAVPVKEARAQVDVQVAPDVKADAILDKKGRTDGFTKSLNVGATFSFNDSRKVVGAVEGSTMQLGLVLGGRADLVHGQHDWENGLDILHTQTRTPQIDRFTKSTDSLKFKSFYGYHLQTPSWLGPFAQFKLDTQLLRSFDLRTTDVAVRRVARDGSATTRNKAALSSIPLSSSLEPLVLHESLGFFARPIQEADLFFEAKAGAGAQQIIVGDGYTIADQASTPELELLQLRDTSQLGATVEFGAKGSLAESVTWQANANFFYPVYTSIDTNETGVDTISTDLSGKVSVRLAKWASLDYVLTVKRVPLILDEWQIQNGIMLTAGFNLI